MLEQEEGGYVVDQADHRRSSPPTSKVSMDQAWAEMQNLFSGVEKLRNSSKPGPATPTNLKFKDF